MKAVVLFSGLGNQLFQYAFYKGLSKKYSDVYVITNQPFGKNQHNGEEICEIFDINPPRNSWFYSTMLHNKIFRKSILGLKLAKVYEPESNFFNINKYIFEVYIGYFMNLAHFDFIRDELIDELKPRDKLDSTNLNMIDRMNNTNSLGIHIRRGDFLTFRGGICLDLAYYKNAISYIQNRVSNLELFIFSDDLDFVKKEFLALIGGGEIIKIFI